MGLVHVERPDEAAAWAAGWLRSWASFLLASRRDRGTSLDGLFATCLRAVALPGGDATTQASAQPLASARCVWPARLLWNHVRSRASALWAAGNVDDLKQFAALNLCIAAVFLCCMPPASVKAAHRD